MESGPTASLITLPTEILWQICDEIRGEVSSNKTVAENRQPGSTNLCNLSRCHSRLSAAARSVLYRDVCFDKRTVGRVWMLNRTLEEYHHKHVSKTVAYTIVEFLVKTTQEEYKERVVPNPAVLIKGLQLEYDPKGSWVFGEHLQKLVHLVTSQMKELPYFRLPGPGCFMGYNEMPIARIIRDRSLRLARLKEVVFGEGNLHLQCLEGLATVKTLHLVHGPRHPHYNYGVPKDWKWPHPGLESLTVTFPGIHLQDRIRQLHSLVSRFQGLREFRIQGGPDHRVMVNNNPSITPSGRERVLRGGSHILLALHSASPGVQKLHLGCFSGVGRAIINLRDGRYRAPRMEMDTNVAWWPSDTDARRPLDILPLFSALRELSISAHFLEHIQSRYHPDPGSEENNPLIILARDCPSLSSLSILDIELFQAPDNEPASFVNILLKFARALAETKDLKKNISGEDRFPHLKVFGISTLAAGDTQLVTDTQDVWATALPQDGNHPTTITGEATGCPPGLKAIRRRQDRLVQALTAKNEPFTALFAAARVTFMPKLRQFTAKEFYQIRQSRVVQFLPAYSSQDS